MHERVESREPVPTLVIEQLADLTRARAAERPRADAGYDFGAERGRLSFDGFDGVDLQTQLLRRGIEFGGILGPCGDSRELIGPAIRQRCGRVALSDAKQDVTQRQCVALLLVDPNEVVAE